MKPEDPPDWALMSDMIIENPVGTSRFSILPHRASGGGAAASNHLFNDQHVEWVDWNGSRGDARERLLGSAGSLPLAQEAD